MEVEVKEPFQPVVVPDGIYPAKISKIELLSQDEYNLEFGDAFSIHFEITDGEHEGKVVKGLTSTLLSSRSKLGKLMSKIGIKYEVGQKIDTDVLLDKKCRVITELVLKKFKDGTEFEQSVVKDVLSAEKKTKQSLIEKTFEEQK